MQAGRRGLWNVMAIFCWQLLDGNLPLWAGPVNSAASLPFASANSAGDYLALGDLKGLVYWRQGAAQRVAALAWQKPLAATERFTGGLAEPSYDAAQHPAAIACSERQTQLFDATRTAAAPAGRWRQLAANSGEVAALRRCAMLADGTFAELFNEEGSVQINRQQVFNLGEKNTTAELIAAGGGFIILAPNGAAWSLYWAQERWQLSPQWQHPFADFESTARVTGNDRQVLLASPEGVALAAIEGTASGPRLSKSQRLPINPCDQDQVCGLALARDDSWLVSGYWGHYLGIGQQFRRLPILLSVTKGSGGVAIAHSGAGGSYIYLGADDGDLGTLPPIAAESTFYGEESQAKRWMIWRRSEAAIAASRPLLQLSLDRRGAQSLPEPLYMEVWEGPLPEDIPSTWIAWEAAQEFAAPDWTNAGASAEASDTWFLDSIGAPQAWQSLDAMGLKPVALHAAVIDSGIDLRHPWLQQQILHNPQEIPLNGLDDDDNGFVDDVLGYDFVEEDAEPQDEFGHGTHVAGLLAAHAPAAELGRSPAANLQLTVVRALNRSGKSNSIDLARALLYAAARGAQLINCSWGGGADTQSLRDAFAALQARGIIVFSSAGNNKIDTDKSPEVPKNYPGVRSVGASNRRGQLARFSNYGRQSVRYLAPGDAVVSTVMGGGFAAKSGTSMAAPIAAASYAWLWGALMAKYPDVGASELATRTDTVLCSTSTKAGIQSRSLCGRLRLDQAVDAL